MRYTCPNGHQIDSEDFTQIICEDCNLIATALDGNTVTEWADLDDHHDACANLQDQLDGAFDNQYFGAGFSHSVNP